jgi:hypothetical protein
MTRQAAAAAGWSVAGAPPRASSSGRGHLAGARSQPCPAPPGCRRGRPDRSRRPGQPDRGRLPPEVSRQQPGLNAASGHARPDGNCTPASEKQASDPELGLAVGRTAGLTGLCMVRADWFAAPPGPSARSLRRGCGSDRYGDRHLYGGGPDRLSPVGAVRRPRLCLLLSRLPDGQAAALPARVRGQRAGHLVTARPDHLPRAAGRGHCRLPCRRPSHSA